MTMPLHEISIPQELVDDIIDHVARIASPWRIPDLIACSLSSRSLRSRTLRYLFCCLDTGTPRFQRIGQWRRFAAIVSQSPHIATSYTSLILRHALDFFPHYGSGFSATLKCIFSSLINITHLTVVGPTAGLMKYSIPKYLSSMPITSVTMDRTRFDTLLNFRDFFGDGLRGVDSLTLASVSVGPSSAVERGSDPPSHTIREIRLSYVDASILEAIVDGHLGRLDLHALSYKGITYPSMFPKLLFSCISFRELTLVVESWSARIPPLPCCLPHLELLHLDIVNLEWLSSSIVAGHIGGSLQTLALSVTDQAFRSTAIIAILARFNEVMIDNLGQFPRLKEVGVECEEYYRSSSEPLIRHYLKALPVKWTILARDSDSELYVLTGCSSLSVFY
ncbi:hypothetical protein BDZ89DRAFT_1085275 [Hymenopellis radicata]|nr:hypothetical protein BDZ89DRAFT_1085275 [Hymenopellis radicata]